MTAVHQSSAPPLSASKLQQLVKLNVGCGPIQPEGWVNVDNSQRARLRRWLPPVDGMCVKLGLIPPTEFTGQTQTFNLVHRWPLAAESVAAIYGGEVFEHFTQAEGVRFLAECFRVLAPGGVLRLRVPDNYIFWKNYVREFEDCRSRDAADWNDRHSRWVEMFFRDICVRRQLLGSYGHFHKWAYDEISLSLAFRAAGFTQVERKDYHDSRIADIQAVEVCELLIIEGVKPTA